MSTNENDALGLATPKSERSGEFKRTPSHDEYTGRRAEAQREKRSKVKELFINEKRLKVDQEAQVAQDGTNEQYIVNKVRSIKMFLNSAAKSSELRSLKEIRTLLSSGADFRQTALAIELVIKDHLETVGHLSTQRKGASMEVDDDDDVQMSTGGSSSSRPSATSILQFVIDMMKNPSLGYEYQIEAAWCITNIASGTTEQTKYVAETTCYLIQYLGSGHSVLQDQCAWALGNLAMDCKEIRDQIIAQGGVSQLVALLASDNKSLLVTACYSLTAIFRMDISSKQRSWVQYLIPNICTYINYHLKSKKTSNSLLARLLWLFCDILLKCVQCEIPALEKLQKDSSILQSVIGFIDSTQLDLVTPSIRIMGCIVCDEPLFTSLLQSLQEPVQAVIARIVKLPGTLLQSGIDSSLVISIIKESLYYLSNAIFYKSYFKSSNPIEYVIQSNYIDQLCTLKLNDLFSTNLIGFESIQIEFTQLFYNLYIDEQAQTQAYLKEKFNQYKFTQVIQSSPLAKELDRIINNH